MDSQYQRKAHTPGHESHGVHVCHKCGWPFPNPHPSAKHRRAHKKTCGTIQGYKVCLSDDQTRNLNGSDDEHGSDDDHKSPGAKILEVGDNKKGDNGIGEKIQRSEDEVFSDAVADFSDVELSQEVKQRLQEENADSGTTLERVDKKDPTFAVSSEHNDLNDVSKLTLEAGDDFQVQHPEISYNEMVDEGNTIELKRHLSGSTVDPLSDSVADLRAEESIVVHSDDIIGSSTEAHLSKVEAIPGVLPENQSFSGEYVACCSLTTSTMETNSNLNGKDEIKSESKKVKIVGPCDTIVGEIFEVQSKVEVSDAVYSDDQVAEGALNQKEKDSVESLSMLALDEPASESISIGITNTSINDVQVETSHVSDVTILQEKEEANVDANNLVAHDGRTDVPRLQSENEDFKDHKGVVSRNPSGLLHSYESVKHEEDELKDTVTEENIILLNPRQLGSDVVSPDLHNVTYSSGSVNKELINSEPRAEEIHAKGHTEVSPVESTERSDDIGVSINDIKSEMSESHLVPSSKVQGPVDVENSHQVCLSENILMASSDVNPRDACFGAETSEATSVISIDDTNRHEKRGIETNDIYVEGKDEGANLKKDIGTETNDIRSSDLLQLDIKQSNDLAQSEDAGEMYKTEKLDTTEARCSKTASNQIASPIISDGVINESSKMSTEMEYTNKGQQSGSPEDVKEDEIKSNAEVHEECNRSVSTSADSHQEQDAELLMKAADDPAEKYTSYSSLNAEPSAQNDFSVGDKQDGHPGREVSGTTAMLVQDQSGDNLVKLSSSGIDASAHSSSRCDSLDANWGSVSVLSMQSDATAVIDTETSPSTVLAASKEAGAGESNLNNHNTASEKQPSTKSDMFEAPSFMTLVEPGHAVSHKAPASEGQKGKNPQQPSSTTSQASWFPYVTQVNNESQGRNKNEEIIAKVTNWSTSKEHTPLKSLLGEAIHSNSPKLEENSVNQKNGQKVQESNNGSGLTTVNSILGPESPSSAQAVIGDTAKWNSPARYPADMKREKRKSKSRPYWIQLVCCSTVDLQRR